MNKIKILFLNYLYILFGNGSNLFLNILIGLFFYTLYMYNISFYIYPDIYIFIFSVYIVAYYLLYLFYIYRKRLAKPLESSKVVSTNIIIWIPVASYIKSCVENTLLGSFILYLLVLYKILNSGVYFHLFFTNSFVITPLILFIKILVVMFTFLILKSSSYIMLHSLKSEFFIILIFSVLALILLLSSYNFMSFFILLECFNLTLCLLLVSFSKTSIAVESALRYFIISILSACILLFSIGYFYLVLGTISFGDIELLCATPFDEGLQFKLQLVIGLFFFSLFIKLGIFPIHFWLFEVYEGANFIVLCYLIIVAKVVFFFFLHFFINNMFICFWSFIHIFFYMIAVITIIVFSIMCAQQTTLKGFIICSSLVNSGFQLVPLACSGFDSSIAFFIFLFIYNIYFILFIIFIYLLGCYRVSIQGKQLVTKLVYLTDLTYIKDTYIKVLLTLFLLIFIGLPPFSGFYLKYTIVLCALNTGNYILVVLLLYFSALNAYYYLRLVRLLWFQSSKSLNNNKSSGTVIKITFIKHKSNIFFLVSLCLMVSVFYFPFHIYICKAFYILLYLQ